LRSYDLALWCHISLKNLLIGVQGTKTPAGNSGRAETPQELAPRRLSAAPRKAKCLERKSTASFRSCKSMESIYFLYELLHILKAGIPAFLFCIFKQLSINKTPIPATSFSPKMSYSPQTPHRLVQISSRDRWEDYAFKSR
jgi:hypothetical protein